MSMSEATHVLLVDDHAMVRDGIAYSLRAYSDIAVVGQASSGEEALDRCAQLQPDVVLMDLVMPGMGGVAAIQALHERDAQLPVLALTSYQEGNLVQQALQAGAISYLLKDIEAGELAKAIRLAHRGLPTLAAAAAQALVRTVTTHPPTLGQDLTAREREVLALVTEGLSNDQIAERLVITPATVKFHTRSIRSKLAASSRTEIVSIALRQHLVPDV
jgi:NarL family two-component system response regulator LiaR